MEIREMQAADKQEVLSMMRVFYRSEAVYTNGSDEIFEADIDNCTGDCPFLEGYIFFEGNTIAGYAMVAKSFSTEFGKPCMWLEDLYLKADFRGKGIIPKFFQYIEAKYPGSIFRLEVENENKHAVHVYQKAGYEVLPYVEMKKELK